MNTDPKPVLWNRNRKRRNRNFLPCGTETVTRQKVFVFLHFDFLHLTFFSFTFYNKCVDTYNLFPCETAYYVKRKQIFKEKFAFYGMIWSWNRNRNRNFPKVGTGTITFSKVGTGTITFRKSEPDP